jgi:general secretion pathway protein D
LILLAVLLVAPPVLAQNDAGDPPPAVEEEIPRGRFGRRSLEPGMVPITWDEIAVPDTLQWIAEATGKVVMPVNLVALKNKKISLQTDALIERSQALDMLFQAFRLNGVGVIEKSDVVIIGMIDEIIQVRQMPVLTADDDVMLRDDKGSLVMKIFQLEEVKAEDVGEHIGENLPSYATINVDPNSNQSVVMGDIGLCQHLQQLIEELDNQYVQARTETFRLAYADATEVSENINELYGETGATGSSGTRRQPGGRTPPGGRGGQQQRTGSGPIGPEIELRVTVNTQQNSLTVSAEPSVVEEIARLIETEWDLPRSPGTSRIYTLHYTDPLKVADKLNRLLGGGGTSGGGGQRSTGARGGQGGGGDVAQILQGIYSIEPYPDTSQLLVFCKTEASLDFLDQVITDLDQPSSIGLPFVCELKHANAIELAEELNALLSEPGSGATLERPGEGLGGREEGGEGGGGDAGSAGSIQFPWQRGGRQRDDQSPESALIGKVRLVPIVRQNALAVLCPAPQREAVRELIQYFDRPGRQVMISAVIAEVELTDDLNLGVRLSNSDEILGGANPDFRLGATGDITGQRDDVFSNFFDTSILDAAIPVRVAIQALQQDTNVRILQEPVIFTADNQEALFFDGQDIPFITDTVVNANGNPTSSFEYREVGVTLNVRPRITVERDVDLEILLELSSIVPGVTLFGGAVIDRRETRTHVVVSNGQTIVISGILREEESKITRKVPLLGDIPILGELFKSRENSTTTTELIAFVTPHVVDTPSQNDSNFQERFRERLDELTHSVEDQARDRKENPERYRQRFLPFKWDVDGPPTSQPSSGDASGGGS